MKSFKMISLVIFIALISITVKDVHSAMPESIFLQAKVTDIRNFEECTDELLIKDGIIDAYYNSSNNVLTIIFDSQKISKDEIFENFHQKGFKIKSQTRTTYSKNTEFIKSIGSAIKSPRLSSIRN